LPEESKFTPEDWRVFAEYGRTMLSVQKFEFTLAKVIYSEEEPELVDEASVDRLVKLLAELSRLTAGQLKGRVAKIQSFAEDLLRDIEQAAGHRNRLAHEYLYYYEESRRANPRVYEDVILNLQSARRRFQDLTSRLDKWMQAKGARESEKE
jgi:hypothetical protein